MITIDHHRAQQLDRVQISSGDKRQRMRRILTFCKYTADKLMQVHNSFYTQYAKK